MVEVDSINITYLQSDEVEKSRVFIPIIMKIGFRHIDAEAMLDAYIRYGVAQFIIDFEGTSEKDIKIRPIEGSDIKDEKINFDDKVVIIFGAENKILNPPILLKRGDTGLFNKTPYGLVFFK